jgi:hypothetical protein
MDSNFGGGVNLETLSTSSKRIKLSTFTCEICLTQNFKHSEHLGGSSIGGALYSYIECDGLKSALPVR